MEIVNQTDQELLLKTPIEEVKKIKKIGLFIILFSSFLLLISVNKSGTNQLKCEKINEIQFSCQLTKTKLMGFYKLENIYINSIDEVKFEQAQVIIVSENKNIYWSPYKDHQTRLSNWINNPNSNNQLTIKYGNIFAQLVLIIILIFFLIAGFQMFKNEGETLVFKKDIKRFTYSYKNLGFTQIFESPFQDIKKFEHKFVSSLDGSKYYVVNLVLNTKNLINLSQCILLYSSKNEIESLNLLNSLRKFLKHT